jgi:hypothetical protein
MSAYVMSGRKGIPSRRSIAAKESDPAHAGKKESKETVKGPVSKAVRHETGSQEIGR